MAAETFSIRMSAAFCCGAGHHGPRATVRANAAILVTNNTREFTRVPGLLVENWLEAQSG